MELQIICFVINSILASAVVYQVRKQKAIRKECNELLDEIEERNKKEIEWNQQLTDKLCQKSYNDGYQEGFQNGRMQGKKKHKKR